ANIAVNTAGTYDVSTSNSCGSGSASVMVTEEVTPSISTISCTNTNDQLVFTVSASDNDNIGITFTFHEGDPANPALTDGGDYSLAIGMTLATLTVSNVHTNHQGVNFYAKATNSCGTSLSVACLALPIELEYFTGRYTGEAVVLDWATATETDNDYFSIERSTDGLNFKEIERIEGAGTSYFTLKYSYTDEEAPLYKQVGTLYYRLKQTDYNGSFSYSDVLAVQLGDAQAFEIDRITLSASQELQFSLQSARAAEAQISLYRMDGSRLLTQPIALRKGVQSYTVALSAELASGLYLLRVESGAQTAVKKFSLSR
ncbi:MAG TPA: T9SS type A sorting domain-containing protein, partial [Phaeodactylibacter sp.]|nr:T9SS type A sorting domain-containing protein [Phaeodactylibacter sp.]